MHTPADLFVAYLMATRFEDPAFRSALERMLQELDERFPPPSEGDARPEKICTIPWVRD